MTISTISRSPEIGATVRICSVWKNENGVPMRNNTKKVMRAKLRPFQIIYANRIARITVPTKTADAERPSDNMSTAMMNAMNAGGNARGAIFESIDAFRMNVMNSAAHTMQRSLTAMVTFFGLVICLGSTRDSFHRAQLQTLYRP